jgi:excinuclease ABC subunit A
MISGRKGTHEKLFGRLKKDGFARVRINGEITELDRVVKLNKNKKHDIEVVVDRLVVKPSIEKRLADSIELATGQSEGLVKVLIHDPKNNTFNDSMFFSEKASCTHCGVSYPEFTPASFSFNSPQGACTACGGIGSTTDFDTALIIPNPELSLREGAVAPWSNRSSVHFAEFLDALTGNYGVDIYTPVKNLPDQFMNVLLHGTGNQKITFYFEGDKGRVTYKKPFEGIIAQLKRKFEETGSHSEREEIRQYMDYAPCPECKGQRLNAAGLNVRLGNLNLPEITSFSISETRSFFKKLITELPKKQQIISDLL